jgi:hypothetical protein
MAVLIYYTKQVPLITSDSGGGKGCRTRTDYRFTNIS